MKVANPIDRAMQARMQSHGNDWVFTPADFIDLGKRHAVDKALSRMTAAGSIRRAGRGYASQYATADCRPQTIG